MGEQAYLLDDIANPPPEFYHIRPADVLAEQGDFPAVRFIQAVYHFQERRFPAAGGTEDCDKFPFCYGKRHMVDGIKGRPAECLSHVLEINCVYHWDTS